jgi:hypothetical protein
VVLPGDDFLGIRVPEARTGCLHPRKIFTKAGEKKEIREHIEKEKIMPAGHERKKNSCKQERTVKNQMGSRISIDSQSFPGGR